MESGKLKGIKVWLVNTGKIDSEHVYGVTNTGILICKSVRGDFIEVPQNGSHLVQYGDGGDIELY